MIRKGLIRASVPFVVKETTMFGADFEKKAAELGWKKAAMGGNLLLRHINTSFTKNAVCIEKQLSDKDYQVPVKLDDREVRYPFTITQVQVCCFDTGIGFFTFHIPYEGPVEEEVVVNSCSALHASVPHANKARQREILCGEKETCLSCLAEKYLTALLDKAYTLFATQHDTALRRINVFSAILCEQDSAENGKANHEKSCYRLAQAYDTRDDDLKIDREKDIHWAQEYIRWSFSKRGCAAVANLTGKKSTDFFLENIWLNSVKTNYFYLHLMVLHEKLASYYYLNQVADDPDMSKWKINQKSLLDFNSKYIFTVVSDEALVQGVYKKMKTAANADEVYAEMQEQLRRMFDYAQIKANEATESTNDLLNLISVIVGVVCSVSVIFECISMFTEWGWIFGFDCVRNGLFTGAILLEVALFVGVLIMVLTAGKRKK